MGSLEEFALEKLNALERASLRRRLNETARADGVRVRRNGRELLSFCCNDYLNLTQHPALKEAAVAAIAQYGVGAGASRLVTGNHPLYAELEAKLARLKRTEAACVFGSGYLANTGVIPVLTGSDDLVLIDALAHASLWTGARLSRATVISFRHNDVQHAHALLAEHRARHPRTLIVTEGIFSMDGDRARLDELAKVARAADAWLMVDDAHAIGVINEGRGSVLREACVNLLQIGTLSKAIGAYGGFLCASQAVIDLIVNRARPLIYATGLPPATVAAAHAALELIVREPGYVALPLAKAKAFTRRAGLPEAESAIVPVVVGTATAALAASALLENEGFLVVAIRPPTVPEGTARLRITFTASHADTDVARLADLVRTKILAKR
ncbi:MAG TPA: 8-amino-7-oxononanoate synthase [Xanthobacteraceae bacterium]|nr:8-amino-7-oxononanoate synthase [Xanthobacteraceae bacterium]